LTGRGTWRRAVGWALLFHHRALHRSLPSCVRDLGRDFLVVTGTMEFYDFPYIGNVISSQLTQLIFQLHHFSEGWLNHQPDNQQSLAIINHH
jgi:hypothetical protein